MVANFSAYNGLDYTIIGIVIVAALFGLKRGIVTEVLAVIGLVASYVAALIVGQRLDRAFAHSVSDDQLRDLLGFLIVFVVCVIVAWIIVRFLTLFLSIKDKSVLNRVFGALIGGAKGLLFAFILVFIISMTAWKTTPWFEGSKLAFSCQQGAMWIKNQVMMINDEAKGKKAHKHRHR